MLSSGRSLSARFSDSQLANNHNNHNLNQTIREIARLQIVDREVHSVNKLFEIREFYEFANCDSLPAVDWLKSRLISDLKPSGARLETLLLDCL